MSTDRLSGWNPNASNSSAPRCQNCDEHVLEGTAHEIVTDGGSKMDLEDMDCPWRNESILRELCVDEQLPITGVADRLGCNRNTVYRWLKKHGISENGAPPKPSPEYTDPDVLEELYWGEEMSMPEIAEKFGCHYVTIQRWMDKHDIEARDADPANRREKPWRDESTLRELYVDEKLSIFEIADRLDCGYATVDEWLSRYGIEKRDQMEWSRINRGHMPAAFWMNADGYEG